MLRETTHNNTHEKIFLKNLLLLLAAASPSADAALVPILSAFSLLSFFGEDFSFVSTLKIQFTHQKFSSSILEVFFYIFLILKFISQTLLAIFFSLTSPLTHNRVKKRKNWEQKAQGKIYFVCGLNCASRESKSRKWTHSLGSLVTRSCTNSTFNARNSIQDEDFCTI